MFDSYIRVSRVAGREGERYISVEEQRRLIRDAAQRYGDGARGAGGVIKPHEPLVFVVDLLSVE